jgi:ClpP class serine protease
MKNWLPFLKSDPTIAVIRLTGMIGGQGFASLNDAKLAPAIEKAFEKGKPAAVALVVNSPAAG